LVGLVLVLVGVAAAFWLPGWWNDRLSRQIEASTGVGARVLPGSADEARRKIHPGLLSDKVVAAIGKPSFSVHTDGSSTHDIWTYYYANGTMTVNLTDGAIVLIGLDFHPPVIPTSRRR
jgi:hypothetical protein